MAQQGYVVARHRCIGVPGSDGTRTTPKCLRGAFGGCTTRPTCTAMMDGDKLRAVLKELGLSGQALARLVNVTPGTISKILQNNYPGMSLELAERVAWAVRKPLCMLLKTPQPHPEAPH